MLISREETAQLRTRFHKVILGAGYSEAAAQVILQEYFGERIDQLIRELDSFKAMLEKYERNSYDPD